MLSVAYCEFIVFAPLEVLDVSTRQYLSAVGDVDMLRAVRIYKEVGYSYMLMPDHVPGIVGEEAQQVGFAYCYGYILAMIQAANEGAIN